MVWLLLVAGCTGIVPATPAPGGSGEPEYGIYWFGKQDAMQKAVPGRPNPYYDPNRPTMLLIHGWRPDQAYTQRTLMWTVADPATGKESTYDLAAPWIDAGWNIGLFDWGPFADEPVVLDAEAKIWTANGPKGMRWRDHAGSYQTAGVLNISAADLLYRTYLSALADYRGPEIRIAGHSLGNQMATALVMRLVEDLGREDLPPHLLPKRLALLDPYWSPLARDFLNGASTAETVRTDIEDDVLPEGILVEWYRSSSLTDGRVISDANEALQPAVVFVEMAPKFCPITKQICKHEASWQQYLLSFGDPPPPECESPVKDQPCQATGRVAASASTPNDRLAEMLADRATWRQAVGPDGVDGRLTPATHDDWYARIPPPPTAQP